MKKITDSFIRRIVKQGLNENRSLLNEDITDCPDGGFCIGGSNIDTAKEVKDGGGSHLEKLESIGELCGNVKMGKPTMSDNLISTYVDKLYQLLGSGSVYTEVDEGKVKNQLSSLKNFPNFCAVSEVFMEHTGSNLTQDYPGGLRSVNSYPFSQTSDSANEDTKNYIIPPLVDLIKASIKISEDQKITNATEEKTNKEKKDAELLVTAKKCGWNTVDEYKNSGWKCEGPKFTIGGGGDNSVSFVGYECISEHPAKINKQELLPNGAGYKLNTGNKTIDSFVYGVVKNKEGLDNGAQKDLRTGDLLDFTCQDKKIQWSLSNDGWSYDDVAFGGAWDASAGGSVALTTDPDLEDDGKVNQSIQTEIVKGFRHNLLTEAEFKVGDKGPEVGKIQSKLGLKPDKGTPIYGPATKAAVEKFQTDNGITPVTGNIDAATYDKILQKFPDPIQQTGTGYTQDLKVGMSGTDVEFIQTKLGISKGKYGPETEKKVKEFQIKYKLPETGIVDKTTYDKLIQVKAAGTPSTFSGKKHNYKVGDWIKVNPESGNEATQLTENNGFFRISHVPNPYTIILDLDWGQSKGFTTVGGSTQKVLFGEVASEGTKTVIKKGKGGETTVGGGNGESRSGRRLEVGGGGTIDVEAQRKRDLRKKETCDTLRQIKQYLNNTKGLSMTVNCKWNQEIRNQVMLALTGGTPVTPVVEPVASTPGGNVRIY